jgi:hypothetical protein
MLSFQVEEAMGGIAHHDGHEMHFEYVDVAERQFPSQEHGLHAENVDRLSIKQEVPTDGNCEMVSENVTAFSVKEEYPVTRESGGCFENVDTSNWKEYGTCFKIIDVRSIKEEPADEGNLTEDPFAMEEGQICCASSIKKEKDIKQEEQETQFMKTEEIKREAVENIKSMDEGAAGNMDGTQIKEEQSETEGCRGYILDSGNQFSVQDSRIRSVNGSRKGEHLVGDCLNTTVMVKEEELGSAQTNEVFRLVFCFYSLL